jgi:hypothetical protein
LDPAPPVGALGRPRRTVRSPRRHQRRLRQQQRQDSRNGSGNGQHGYGSIAAPLLVDRPRVAPPIRLRDQFGRQVNLAQFRGKAIMLIRPHPSRRESWRMTLGCSPKPSSHTFLLGRAVQWIVLAVIDGGRRWPVERSNATIDAVPSPGAEHALAWPALKPQRS